MLKPGHLDFPIPLHNHTGIGSRPWPRTKSTILLVTNKSALPAIAVFNTAASS